MEHQQAGNEGATLSQRGRSFIKPKNVIEQAFDECSKNGYDPKKNPTGIINLGVSANGVMFDVLKDKITETGFFDSCTIDHFNYFGGMDDTSHAMAAFLMKYAGSVKPIKRENVVVMNGLTTIVHCLAQVICDEGEGILIPTPLYAGFISDLNVQANVSICPVHLSSEKGTDGTAFQLTVALLEKGLSEAQEKGVKVRGLFITTPHNPLGCIYTKKELLSFMEFCKRHGLHFVSDEIYLTTIFGAGKQAVSALSIEENPLDDDHFHVLYGISKDFAANGVRIGGLVSWSDSVVKSMNSLLTFNQTSGLACYVFSKLLLDEKWLEEVFFPTNRRRLLELYEYTAQFLDTIESVSYIPTATGLYVWCDFRKVLDEPTFEAESELNRRMMKAGVALNPGGGFWCKEPGWFRLVFATHKEYLKEAFDRLRGVLST
ncbi:1-aminocyclopropane-1-carboxylate synthase-like protein 1 [Oscarella lobularis]|uniref:1-aminocyclopropane-1-carboxylate synthase-like protein 1 n=1 Tax=Oscarella lobularis TaxID=121494 RepID=UPI0033144569